MPAASPSYPHGPYRFVDREYFIIVYKSDLDAVREAVPEPFMDLLVEISSNAGRSMREYTLLLEEATARGPTPPAASEGSTAAAPGEASGAC